jgi:hypothetical protein
VDQHPRHDQVQHGHHGERVRAHAVRHIDTTTDEAVLYRSKALHTQYNSGDLFHGPADENPWSVDNGGKGRIIGVAEAYGSLTVPTE